MLYTLSISMFTLLYFNVIAIMSVIEMMFEHRFADRWGVFFQTYIATQEDGLSWVMFERNHSQA